MARIVAYEPALRDQVLELQRHLWSDDLALNSAYFDWKYERNPYLETEFIRLAVADDRVVGMRGLWGSEWEAGDPAVRSVVLCGGDLVVASDHRRRGLALELVEAPMPDARDAGYGGVVSVTGSPITQSTFLKAGWRNPGPLGTVRRPASLPTGTRVSCEDEPRPAEMANLVQRLGHDGRFRHVRDAQYFSWRFGCPMHRYRFFFAGKGHLEGYLVLNEVGNIVDWEATNASVRIELLNATIALGGELAIWTVGLPRETKALLHGAGFRTSRSNEGLDEAPRAVRDDPQLLIGYLQPGWEVGGRPVLDLDRWDLRMLYSDLY